MKRIQILTILTILVFASSCTLFNTPPEQTEPSELSDFRAKYLTSFDILNGSFSQSGRALMPFNLPVVDESRARATVPVGLDVALPSIALPLSGQTAEGALTSDYPEVGQRTSWIIENMGNDLYLIQVLTTFPDYDPREKQEEWYYIKDQPLGDPPVPDGIWTTADIVVDSLGVENSTYRLRNWLHFRDGSTQYETVIDVRAGQDIRDGIVDGFGSFKIEESLNYPEVFLPVPAPSTDSPSSPVYSSVVVYTRIYSDQPAYSFWGGNRVRAVVGIRYYTEHLDPATGTATKLIGTTISFEKAVTSLYGIVGDFMDAYSSIFLPYVDANPDQAFLAMTVLRQHTTYALASYTSPSVFTVDYNQSTRDTRAKTRVVNIPTQQDNYITLINDEAEDISTAYDTLWIPTASDPAILNLATAPEVNITTRTYAITTGDASPVEIVMSNPSTSELGELYTAVTDGTTSLIAAAESNGIEEDLTGSTVVVDFDGSQGLLLAPPTGETYAYSDMGTVQAWVYIDSQSKSSGIVHAGVDPSFIDEVWSLELQGNNNTPAFVLTALTPPGSDQLKSSERLRKSTWYYLVATWSIADNNMSIYVNGEPRGSRSLTNISTGSTFAVDSPVVVGSLVYNLEPGTVLLSGYYGTDGKINGVIIENRAWTAAEIQTFYNENQAKTAFW